MVLIFVCLNIGLRRKDGITSVTLRANEQALRLTLQEFMMMIVYSLKMALAYKYITDEVAVMRYIVSACKLNENC